MSDLAYPMGGERGRLEVAHFPTVGKTMIVSKPEGIRAFDDANARQLTFAKFMAKD